ncbi:DNA mismatch repair protein MutS [Desulfurobacterium sp.]
MDNSKRKLTPALKQYFEIKEKYRDTLLMFRMGDFYELFFEDAKIAAKELEITLTSRGFGKSAEKVPMCGVPYHSVEPYIEKLVRKGYKVAICEQMEEPKPGKKVVKREVVRIVTPGTYFEDEKEDRFLMSVYPEGKNYSVSWTELSTGDLFFTTTDRDGLLNIISKFKPKELIVPEKLKTLFKDVKILSPETFFQTKEEFYFNGKETTVTENTGETKSLAALRKFIEETQIEFIPKLKKPKRYSENSFMHIDPHTCRSLEIVESMSNQRKEYSLFGTLDKTLTGMGRRFLKFSLLHPLKDRKEIENRLNSVEELLNSFLTAELIRNILKNVYDIERLLSKITSGVASPKDLAALRRSIKELPELKKLLLSMTSELLKKLGEKLDTLEDIYCELERTIVENPPFSPREGGIIKKGISEELDELKTILEEGEKIIKEIEERERKRTGISSLKVKFNSVFGYYIEVSKANLHLVPDDYMRRQTLVNAERFITPELKEFEEKILSAKEKVEKLEYSLFVNLRKYITENSERIQKTAEIIGNIDFLLSLSKVAEERGYTKPEITDSYNLLIEEGKHPVLEKFLEEDFIPNSIHLSKEKSFAIVTGPNMGGKSVFLRQTALITLMAQIGSFVPAKKAKIGIVDRIFSRVGASDNLSRGLSTFMMEMVETANILHNATEKSLIILDEIGRGTSTYDGISIARAVVEYITSKINAKTLFATHYHELTELEKEIDSVFNLHVSVKEINGKIVFTHKVLPGISEKSYGIHVAELAGLPEFVIERAREILMSIEEKNQLKELELPLFNIQKEEKRETEQTITETESELIKELENIDISTTTPLDALMILARLKKMIKKV